VPPMKPFQAFLSSFEEALPLEQLSFRTVCRPRWQSFPIDGNASTFSTYPKEEQWQPIFNHKDLTGWETVGEAKWEVKDGVLTGSGGQGHIFTTASYENLMLRTTVRVNEGGNSGVYFRVQDKGRWPVGYEAQVDNHDPNNPTGSIYGMHKARKLLTRDGDWFTMQVTADGPHIVVEVNGETVVDAQNTKFQRGPIALQAHDPRSVVEYRNVEIKPLPSATQ